MEIYSNGEWKRALIEDKNTKRYLKWNYTLGGNETSGFLEGVITEHTFDKPLTYNEARTFLKSNLVMNSDGRLYHVINPIE